MASHDLAKKISNGVKIEHGTNQISLVWGHDLALEIWPKSRSQLGTKNWVYHLSRLSQNKLILQII